MARLCRVLGTVWLFLTALMIIASLAMIWRNEGFSAVQEIMSPFNVLNFIVTAVVAAPGVALLMLADRLERSAREITRGQAQTIEPTPKQ